MTALLFQIVDLNLIDWSSQNFLAVALDNSVYLWNHASGEIIQLLQMEHPDVYISSVSWIKEGNYLAVGTSSAEVQVNAGVKLEVFLGIDRTVGPGDKSLAGRERMPCP